MPDAFELPKPPDFEDAVDHGKRRRIASRILVILLLWAGLNAIMLESFPALFGDDKNPGFFQELFDKFGRARRPDPMRIFNRGQTHLRSGKHELALRDADLLIKMKQPLAGHLLRGDALGRLGRYGESIEAYSQVLQLAPDFSLALNNRAYNRALARVDIPQAMEDVERAIRTDGPTPAYIDTRGYLHYLQGNHKRALADLNAVLDDAQGRQFDDQGMAEIHFHRGLVYRQLGDEALAKTDFDAAERLGFKITEYPLPLVGAPAKVKNVAK